MTQDQYGQGTGSAIRGEVLPEDRTDESADRPMTRFQKVASALRGDKPGAAQEETGRDGPATDPDVTAVTRPDGVATEDQTATQPDIFVSTARPDPGESPVAAETSAAGTNGPELRPGQPTDAPGDFGDIAYGNLIPEAAEFRQQWQQIQFKFVDDPRASVTEAADVVAQVTARLEAAIAERQRVISERQHSLRGWWAHGSEGSSADTETLRETLRMYRAFLDQLLGSR